MSHILKYKLHCSHDSYLNRQEASSKRYRVSFCNLALLPKSRSTKYLDDCHALTATEKGFWCLHMHCFCLSACHSSFIFVAKEMSEKSRLGAGKNVVQRGLIDNMMSSSCF